MAAFKEIKERIESIGTTRKITSAMKMVSSAKLVKAQRGIADMMPYSAALESMLANAVLDGDEGRDTPLAAQRATRRVALVVFSSDGALAGAFNSSVAKELRLAVDKYAALGRENIHVYTIGKKIREAAVKSGLPVAEEYSLLAAKPDYEQAARLADHLTDLFTRAEIDRVELIYHHFRSAGSQVLTHEELLPMTPPAADGTPSETYYIFEPSRRDILETLLPKAFRIRLYSVWLDSAASEHAARVIAMQTATENADKLIDELTVQYNKSRQQAITNELLDIIGGSMR